MAPDIAIWVASMSFLAVALYAAAFLAGYHHQPANNERYEHE